MKKKTYKYIIPICVILIALVVFVLPIKNGKTLFNALRTTNSYYDTLPRERQERYDKMKVDSLTIKSRATGTAPFDEGASSDENGKDVSASDNYVRTFDTIKYNIELVVVPNTAHEGVTNSSSFTGGVIKVKARIPNQDTVTLMRWEEDAWMQNVEFSEDNTTITAEYHVPQNVVITNSHLNLTFTIRVDGYKDRVSDDMAPEFEIWMEGNIPDDDSSSAPSKTVKETRQTIISGHGNYNVKLIKDYVNYYEKKNEIDGHYVLTGIMIGLMQDNPALNDLRGLEYPNDNFTVELELSYKATPDGRTPIVVTAETPNSYGAANGTELFTYNVNGDTNSNLKPSSESYVYPSALGRYNPNSSINKKRYKSVYDSGTMSAVQNGSKVIVTFNNYRFDGEFPTENLYSNATAYSSKEGYFVSGLLEFFSPYYYDGINENFDYEFSIDAIILKYSTLMGGNVTGNVDSLDEDSSDNAISYDLAQRTGATYMPLHGVSTTKGWKYLGSKYSKEDGALMIGDTFYILSSYRNNNGPYEGGVDGFFSWNTKFFEYTPKGTNYYDTNQGTVYGFPIDHDLSNVTVKYGLYNDNIQEGITDNILVSRAQFEDFTWYDNYNDAISHGKITAIYIDDPDNTGHFINDSFWFRFTVVLDEDNVGKTSFFRKKTIQYIDAERTNKKYYYNSTNYNSENGYIPTTYNDDGQITSYQNYYELGETILVTGCKTVIDTTVSDLDSTGNPKTAYDVQDGIIHLKTKYGVLVNESNVELTIPLIRIQTTLPEGLTYVSGSANKDPRSVISNPDGTTTIIWEIRNYETYVPMQIEGLLIKFSVAISSTIENNKTITINNTISSSADLSDLGTYRTSNVELRISNLTGSRALKTTTLKLLEPGQSFIVNSNIENIGESTLVNVRTLEILPRLDDENGSQYNGNYTIKPTYVDDVIKLYYATDSIDSLGITTEANGKMTVRNVNFINNPKWIRANLNDIIPANATAIASVTEEIASNSSASYKLEIIPSNNKRGDKYAFSLNMTSDNIEASISSNVVTSTVVQRKISGKAFVDIDENNVYNSGDSLIKNMTVQLLDIDNNLLQTTTTDNSGKYEFNLDSAGKYYIKFENLTGYYLAEKGSTLNSSKVNSDYKSDLLDHTYTVSEPIEVIKDINIGLKRSTSTLVVKYLDKDTNDVLSNEISENYHFYDSYETYPATDISSNYRFSHNEGDPVSGIIDKENVTVIYYYELKPSTITTHHYIAGTTTKIAPDVIQNKKYTERYLTVILDTTNLDYEYVSKTGDPEAGIVNKDSYEINYYYQLKMGTVITHHYLYDNGETTTKLFVDEVSNYYYNETYTTSVSSRLTPNYEFHSRSSNYTGIVKSPSIEVSYYYQLKDSNLDTSVLVTGPETIADKNEVVNYQITFNASILEYMGEAKITIADSLPYEIDLENSDLDGGTYSESSRVVSWTETINNVNTYSEPNGTKNITITKNISVKYNGINGRDRIMINNVGGLIVLSNNVRSSTSQIATDIRINGNIIIKYLDENNNEIKDPTIMTGLVGENVIIEPIELEGHVFKQGPETQEFVFEEEEQTLEFIYKKIVLTVTTKVEGEGGTIRGDESVYYGADSSDGTIIIEADEGYVIDEVYINGEKIDIEPNQEKIVLGSIKNITEDVEVVAKFKEKEQENPDTAKLTYIVMISVLLIIIIVINLLLSRFNKIRNV